ncbi:hypothetical protein E2C01_001830 [Portunus trituberculatus]|uniref:Uncharacterized protein n=1 Tax=Portunus trituberculatus TaxID=210409 RepID=A0A5B7CI90_PORTR|nr:hypothetical protein [Portunus trituberculatus]
MPTLAHCDTGTCLALAPCATTNCQEPYLRRDPSGKARQVLSLGVAQQQRRRWGGKWASGGGAAPVSASSRGSSTNRSLRLPALYLVSRPRRPVTIHPARLKHKQAQHQHISPTSLTAYHAIPSQLPPSPSSSFTNLLTTPLLSTSTSLPRPSHLRYCSLITFLRYCFRHSSPLTPPIIFFLHLDWNTPPITLHPLTIPYTSTS